MFKGKRLFILFLLVATIVLIPWAMSAFMFDATAATAYGSTNQSTQNNSSRNIFENISFKEHKITALELAKLKSEVGVYQQGKNYNQIVNGHGTGLQPPTAEEWNTISENAYVVENISYSNAPSIVDNSNSPYFPPIGNQANQGSCVAWSVGYYTKTYQEAKEHSWNLSGATWDGGYSGYPKQNYQDKIMSPAFVYNLINGGLDEGSTYRRAIQLICFIGDCSWAKMPYNRLNYTVWPSEAAWTEASYYRGNSSGYKYMSVSGNTGISNLKNWLASGNLATVSVDGNKLSLLTDKDMLTLDNYLNPSTNHAATVVGYDENISYNEQNQTRYGAFKIANSWGKGGWEHISDGFYWISYEVMKQIVGTCYYYFDQTNYQPNLFATFNIVDDVRSNCMITVGLGNSTKPIRTKYFFDFVFGGNKPFCSNNIVMDISEFKNDMTSLYNQSFFLKVQDNQILPTNGTITYFAIGNWSALGTPCPTLKYQNVFLNVTFNPYVTSSITLLPAGGSTPLSTTNKFAISFTFAGQPQISHAQNGTLTFAADGGSNLTISGVSTGSIFSGSQEYGNFSIEEWVLNSQGSNVTVPVGSNSTFYYYDLLSQQVAYSIVGGGNPAAPLLTYSMAPTATSAEFDPTIKSISLPEWFPKTIMVLRGTSAFNNSPLLGNAKEQWATPTTFWNISQVNQIPTLITYFHQYQVTANYSTSDGSVPTSNLILSGKHYGSSYQLFLTNTNQTIWFDANTPWAIPTTLTAISGTERWNYSGSISGNMTGAIEIAPIYVHQYYLAVISTYDSPSGSGWYNNGATAYAGLSSGVVSGGTGTQYLFNGWIGGASGSNYLQSNAIIMSSPVTATASWQTQYKIVPSADSYSIINPSSAVWVNAGSSQAFNYSADKDNYVNLVLVDGFSVPITGSYTFNNVQANHVISVTGAANLFIAASAGIGGSINPNGAVSVNYGSNQTFSIAADNGYYIVDVKVNGSSVGAVSTYAFNNIQGSYLISATFAPIPTPSPTPTVTPSPDSTPAPSPAPTLTSSLSTIAPTAVPKPTTTTTIPTPSPVVTNTPSPTVIAETESGLPLVYVGMVIGIIAVTTMVSLLVLNFAKKHQLKIIE